MIITPTPKERGYYMPAEWQHHEATWLSYPHNEESWPGKIETIFPSYHLFVKTLTEVETVHINVQDQAMEERVRQALKAIGTFMVNVEFHHFPTNDAWCRDHGPAILLNRRHPGQRALVNWDHNAWGGKYPFELDTRIPARIAEQMGLTAFEPHIVMEGGSIDVNGCGDLLTTTSCLLNPNRNPNLSREQIEAHLRAYYGVDNIIWLGDGIAGDDTDGHVDDLSRFVDEDTIITAVEEDRNDENYKPLQENLKLLNSCRLLNGKQPTIVELPMPKPVYYDGQRLPASYANFYICNRLVIFPTYKCDNDTRAAYLLEECFPSREIVGIDSTDIIWGLGSFHCLSQQIPD
ncbi:MAG: agmatine deiminase family protein [Bacteroidales bacterium]|nr:agmatine deiminase family protein [Bacteroidales bacterium]